MSNNRIIIKSVTIKNFRSIRNEIIDSKNLNILVGLNDVGKSNVLKALNLFFNNQTDYGVAFDFQKDFSFYFPKASHSTKEIVIEIKFVIPDTYKEKGLFTWKKVWRTNDYFSEEFMNSAGEKPSERSRVIGTLKRVKYRYVPAVKSKEYYKSLLSDLYYTVSAVLDSPLESSVQGFSDVLRNYTLQISNEVSKRVGVDSKLSIPDNLSDLFRTLIFMTQSDDSDYAIPLDMRGDGIQARHIPIILKYIADEDQKTRNQGSVKVSTIWGFEEPENGVELSKAFLMAKDFLDYSEDIQMFITSHSPAFYMIDSSEKAQVIFVTADERTGGTKLAISDDRTSIGDTMGLMPLVAPFIAEKEALVVRAKKMIEENGLSDIPTIFVEGKTDKEELELAISIYSPELNEALNNHRLRIFTKDGEGGCKRLIDWAYSWIYSGNKSKALILFDEDEAGRVSKEELHKSDIYIKKRASALVYVKGIQPSDEIKTIKSKHMDILYEIEHLLSPDFWKILEKRGYTEERPGNEISKMLGKSITREKTVNDILYEKLGDNDLIETIVCKNPHPDKKDKICSLLKKYTTEKLSGFMNGFQPTIQMISKIFTET